MDLQLLDSWSYLLSVIEAPTQLDLRHLRSRLDESRAMLLRGGARLAPEAYSGHWTLRQQIKRHVLEDPKDFIADAEAMKWCLSSLEIDLFPVEQTAAGIAKTLCALLQTEHKETYGLDLVLRMPLPSAVEYSKCVLSKVFSSLREIDPLSIEETDALVSRIAFIDSEKLNAGSSFPLFGCIYLNVLRDGEPWTAYLEHIVHETAHQLLFSFWTSDPILLNDKGAVFDSPLRKEPRPLSAIFHQMFVLSRVIRTWSLFQQSGRFGAEIFKAYSNYQNDEVGDDFVEKFWMAEETVRKHANLTTTGAAIAESCRITVTNFPVRFDA